MEKKAIQNQSQMTPAERPRILIVEDDAAIRQELFTLLENAGYQGEEITDFAHAKEKILAAEADLLLLDINIPGLNGELLLKELRKETSLPVIMVTSRTSEADEVLSMSYGADDYITKPYHPTILLLRIGAVLKRTGSPGSQPSYRGIKVNPAKGVLVKGDRELSLTKNEMIIFLFLLNHQSQIVSRDALMTDLWDNNEFINDNALTVNISRLRQKLSDFGCENAIETKKKQGYILV